MIKSVPVSKELPFETYWKAMCAILVSECAVPGHLGLLKGSTPIDVSLNTITITSATGQWPAAMVSRARELLSVMSRRPMNIVVRPGSLQTVSLRPAPPETGLAQHYQFENFVAGSNNEIALTSALQLATERDSSLRLSPLYIHGPVGLGKTHLAHAIGHRYLRVHPGAQVRVLSGEQFMREVQSHFMKDQIEQFRSRFRKLDLLILDDIQLIGRDSEQSHKQFVALFNFLHEQQRPIVLTSDRPAKHIGKMPQRMVSRLDLGVLVSVGVPDKATRVGILQRHCAQFYGSELGVEVANFLAEHLRNNCRELIGALHRLHTAAEAAGTSATTDLARRVIDQYASSPALVTSDQILDKCAQHFNLRRRDLLSKRRNKKVADARHIAMFLCRELTHASFPAIGDLFNCHHSSVLHACRKIAPLENNSCELTTDIAHLRHELIS